MNKYKQKSIKQESLKQSSIKTPTTEWLIIGI